MNDSINIKEDERLRSLLEGLDTAGVSDALDKLGINGQVGGVFPLNNYAPQFYSKVIIGPAFTVRYVPVGSPAGTVGDFIDLVAKGDVIVIDNDGRLDCTVWGDIMTEYAGLKQIAGTVINGVCRDVNKAMNDQYPIFSSGRFMRTGKERVEVESINQTVSVGNIRVASRDFVVADSNGVVIIPRGKVEEVARIAQEIERKEEEIRASIRKGKSLAAARKDLGYHTLQSKDAT